MYDLLVVGGGAAGFFAAIQLGELYPSANILIIEKSKELLQKVKISGGGRCNVAHAEFIPNELVNNYPRGKKELRGPFHHFCSGDMLAWLDENGVPTKIEEDGRIFPESDSSQTIIDLFMRKAKDFNIAIQTSTSLEDFQLQVNEISEDKRYIVQTNKGNFSAKNLLLATGSSPKAWKFLASKHIPIVPAVPSLFTFHCQDYNITELAGVSAEVECTLAQEKLPTITTKGPLLITHWGFSGPAILKLSAWAARELADVNYQFNIQVNFAPEFSTLEEAFEALKKTSEANPKQQISTRSQFELPKRLWQKLMELAGVKNEQKWVETSHTELKKIAQQLISSTFNITGKSTFKEEFVTAGGVDLKAINFKNFQFKEFPNLYIAGECLNIDAVTGGFNFQYAWTGAYLVAKDVAKSLE